jgi:hypothetical protein
MLAVIIDVGHVIDDIDRSGYHAQQYEPGDGSTQVVQFGQFFIKDEGGKDKDVLDPLLGSHGFDQPDNHALASE